MMKFGMKIAAILMVTTVPLAFSSRGDASPEQRNCVARCIWKVCANFRDDDRHFMDKITQWRCHDMCTYDCMWKTVALFHRNNLPTPQFSGKWPFIRFLGIQEPASTVFSAMNFAAHAYLLRRFLKRIPEGAPMRRTWLFYGLVSMNAWTFSTVFHTRDVDFTEKLDYFCAFSMVVYSLLAFFLRTFGYWRTPGKVQWANYAMGICTLGLFARHVYIMSYDKFDYSYNMAVNVAVGLVNSICWLAWCYKNRLDKRYVGTAVKAVLILDLTVLLELLDFVPIFWTLDAHALWHLSTVPIHFLWYDFITRDCEYLLAKEANRRWSD